MAIVFMTDPDTGRCALYEEPTTTGSADDPNSARNAPLNSPSDNLQYLYFHSDYDPMEVAIGPVDVTVNHGSIAASSASGGDVGTITTGQVYGGYTSDYAVYTHGLGYIPDFLAVVGSDIMHPGYPVQFASDGRCRFVTFYATTTEIRAYEFAIQTASTLSAVSVEYSLLILRPPPAPSGNVLMDFDPDTGIVTMGKGKFSSDRKYLQIVTGGSPFALPTGKTVDLDNGTFRSVAADGTLRDIVPSSFGISFGAYGSQSGGPGNYGGSFTGETVIQVQAP